MILLFYAMPCLSQEKPSNSSVNEVNQTVTLNSEGVKNIGNALYKGDGYKILYSDCITLTENLYKESNMVRENNNFLKKY